MPEAENENLILAMWEDYERAGLDRSLAQEALIGLHREKAA
jgi:hypothetical protein